MRNKAKRKTSTPRQVSLSSLTKQLAGLKDLPANRTPLKNDPIFPALTNHIKAAEAHRVAVDIREYRADTKHANTRNAARDRAIDKALKVLRRADIKLFGTTPTTLAGLTVLGAYVLGVEQRGDCFFDASSLPATSLPKCGAIPQEMIHYHAQVLRSLAVVQGLDAKSITQLMN